MTVDHVIPVSLGGGNNLKNLRPAHASCNERRGNDYPQCHIDPETVQRYPLRESYGWVKRNGELVREGFGIETAT